jgi:hypothetical protein
MMTMSTTTPKVDDVDVDHDAADNFSVVADDVTRSTTQIQHL